MPIRDGNVQPPVVIIVEKLAAESDERSRRGADARSGRGIYEYIGSFVVVERLRLALECGDEQIQPAIVVVIAPIDSHASVNIPVTVEGRSGLCGIVLIVRRGHSLHGY